VNALADETDYCETDYCTSCDGTGTVTCPKCGGEGLGPSAYVPDVADASISCQNEGCPSMYWGIWRQRREEFTPPGWVRVHYVRGGDGDQLQGTQIEQIFCPLCAPAQLPVWPTYCVPREESRS
jgi:hypothetical protein